MATFFVARLSYFHSSYAEMENEWSNSIIINHSERIKILNFSNAYFPNRVSYKIKSKFFARYTLNGTFYVWTEMFCCNLTFYYENFFFFLISNQTLCEKFNIFSNKGKCVHHVSLHERNKILWAHKEKNNKMKSRYVTKITSVFMAFTTMRKLIEEKMVI